MTSEEFAFAYRKGYPYTVRFLGVKGLPPEHAEEAAQAGWARGWERIDQLRNPDRLLQWVATIALNVYRRMLRSSKRDVTLLDIAVAPVINHAAIDVEYLLSYAGKHRDLIESYHIDGMGVDQLAAKYSCSRTAVRIRLSRARRAMATACLESYGPEEERETELPVRKRAGREANATRSLHFHPA